MTPAAWLRERADSYWRDAEALTREGDADSAVAYRIIAGELRKCAENFPVSC